MKSYQVHFGISIMKIIKQLIQIHCEPKNKDNKWNMSWKFIHTRYKKLICRDPRTEKLVRADHVIRIRSGLNAYLEYEMKNRDNWYHAAVKKIWIIHGMNFMLSKRCITSCYRYGWKKSRKIKGAKGTIFAYKREWTYWKIITR